METCLSWCLIINNPPSRGLILSFEEEVWEEVPLEEKGEECSLSTSFLRFKAMVPLVGKFEAMTNYMNGKNLVHFLFPLKVDVWVIFSFELRNLWSLLLL